MRDSNVANAAKESTQREFSHGLTGHCTTAGALLANPDIPVADVADRLGYRLRRCIGICQPRRPANSSSPWLPRGRGLHCAFMRVPDEQAAMRFSHLVIFSLWLLLRRL